MVLPQTEHKQSDGPLPQLTATWTLPPSPLSLPILALLRCSHHPHPPSTAVQLTALCTGDIAHSAKIWERDELDVGREEMILSDYVEFFHVKMWCITLVELVNIQRPPPPPQALIFVSMWFQTLIPALLSFTDRIWAHLWMSSRMWMIVLFFFPLSDSFIHQMSW